MDTIYEYRDGRKFSFAKDLVVVCQPDGNKTAAFIGMPPASKRDGRPFVRITPGDSVEIHETVNRHGGRAFDFVLPGTFETNPRNAGVPGAIDRLRGGPRRRARRATSERGTI